MTPGISSLQVVLRARSPSSQIVNHVINELYKVGNSNLPYIELLKLFPYIAVQAI